MDDDLRAVLIDALRRVSAGEWIEADAVARVLRSDGHGTYEAPVVGRWLSKLAEEGHCERALGAVSKYRIGLRAVVVYGDEGRESGRLLLWQTRDGVELDFSLLQGWPPILLTDRDIRTVRGALDEGLSRMHWPTRTRRA